MKTKTVNNKKGGRKAIVFAVMILLFAGSMWLIFAPSRAEQDELLADSGFNTVMPDPTHKELYGDKREAYAQEQLQQKREQRMMSLEELAYMLGEDQSSVEKFYEGDAEDGKIRESVAFNQNPYKRPAPAGSASNSVQQSISAYEDLNKTLGGFYAAPAADPADELFEKIAELEMQLGAERSRDDLLEDQLYLLEKSYELAAKYMPQQPEAPAGKLPEESESSGRRKVSPVGQITHQLVTALPQNVSTTEFVTAYSQPRNYGFHSLDNEPQTTDRNTIGAQVHGEHVVIDGQIVRLRITEPFLVGKDVIPANTIVTGICRITGERLNISIPSIEAQGKIIMVDMNVYDTDGLPGIHIPGSMELDAAKEIAANMGNALNSTINISQQSAGEQLLTDMGRSVISGTSQYISKKIRQVKVTLKPGYRVMLLPSERN